MKPQKIHPMFVGGEEVPAASGKTFAVENPATGAEIAQVAEGDAEDIERAVGIATEASVEWGRIQGEERAAIMTRVAGLLEASMEAFVELEVAQTGRPVRELSAQLARLPEWYHYFGALARTEEGTVPPFGAGHLNYTRRVPLGVVGQITPWNHPLLILTKKVAPALAAGNAIVAKPSELAPLTALMLGDVMREAGVPAGVFNVVPGFGNTAGRALAGHAGINKIDVTGGTETGKAIAALAGANLTRVSAELGGKASVIVFGDIPVDEAVSAIMFAGFIATGQTCVQGARAVVHRSLYDEVVRRLAERSGKITVGDPTDPHTQMGPLVSARQLATTERYVKLGLEQGATLVTGGQRLSGPSLDKGYFYAPTVFSDVTNEMAIAQEEIFGPVVCLLPFDSEEEAIALGNGTVYGLSSSVWTRDGGRAHRVAHALHCGVVWINDHHRIGPGSPWGGLKMSGMGRENGITAYHEYTQIQNVIVKTSAESFDWYTPDAAGKRYS